MRGNTDPAGCPTNDDVERIFGKLIEQARPQERDKLTAMNADERRRIAETYQSQMDDNEPSSLVKNPRLKVKHIKKL